MHFWQKGEGSALCTIIDISASLASLQPSYAACVFLCPCFLSILYSSSCIGIASLHVSLGVAEIVALEK